MPAGTIALTNNSTAVTGSGTNFSSELKANDFIVAIVGGGTYTLGVQSVNSATSVTLTTAYNGPNASGVAWTAVPNAALVGITAQVAADVAKAIRGLNLDKANWQQVYSASGNITVTLPDGSAYIGPSWNSLSTSLGLKANQSDVNAVANTVSGALFKNNNLLDVPDKDSARKNLGLGSTNTVFFSGIACRQGVNGGFGSNKFNFFWNTQSQLEAWIDTSKVGNVTLSSTSDKGLKKDIKYRQDSSRALAEVIQWRPADFKMKERGIVPESVEQLGFIANDLVQVSPECVSGIGLPEDYDIENDPNNSDAYYLNQIPMIAKLAQAIQAQHKIIDDQSELIKAMGVRLKDLDGLDG